MSEIYCPVCGAYCLGKGGHGCIDKPTLVGAADKDNPSDYADLLSRHNALVEAVAWERECEAVRNKNRMFRNWPETVEAERSYDAARAEVDRLLGGE